jgi:hypothetical protein
LLILASTGTSLRVWKCITLKSNQECAKSLLDILFCNFRSLSYNNFIFIGTKLITLSLSGSEDILPIPRQESEWSCMCVLGRPL